MFAGGQDMQPPPGLAIPAQPVHLAPVVAKSTSTRQNRGKFNGSSCCTWGCRSLWKSAAFCFRTIPTLDLFSPALGVALAALLHNMATLTGAAGKFGDAGANVSVAFAHLAVSGTSGTVSIIDETWHGVDLTQLEVHAESGAINLDDNEDFDDYLSSPAGAFLWKMPLRTRVFAAAVVNQASISLPYQSISTSWLNVSESYEQFSLEVTLNEECMWDVKWVFVSAFFVPRWSNPAWQLLDMDFGTEEKQIREKLESIIKQQLELLRPLKPRTIIKPNFRKRFWRKAVLAASKLTPANYRGEEPESHPPRLED